MKIRYLFVLAALVVRFGSSPAQQLTNRAAHGNSTSYQAEPSIAAFRDGAGTTRIVVLYRKQETRVNHWQQAYQRIACWRWGSNGDSSFADEFANAVDSETFPSAFCYAESN
jgi:hypothetical protein